MDWLGDLLVLLIFLFIGLGIYMRRTGKNLRDVLQEFRGGLKDD